MATPGISRRTLLRGVGAAVALPWLEAMGPLRSWAADIPAKQAAPNRLAVLYVRLYARGFRPAASLPTVGTRRGSPTLERLDAALTNFLEEVRLVA